MKKIALVLRHKMQVSDPQYQVIHQMRDLSCDLVGTDGMVVGKKCSSLLRYRLVVVASFISTPWDVNFDELLHLGHYLPSC